MVPMRRVASLLALALAALLPAMADAAVYKPKPKRLVSATSAAAGPVLAGGRIVWIGYGNDETDLYMRSRSRLTVVPIPARRRAVDYLAPYDLDASPHQVGYVLAEEEVEQRDAFPVDYYFGAISPGERSVTPFFNCIVIDGCTYRDGGVEVTGNYIASGPFTPRGAEEPQTLLVTDRRTRETQLVTLPEPLRRYRDFKMAGRFIAYRADDPEGSVPTIVLLDWRRGEVVRRVRPVAADTGSTSVGFDVDAAGRIAVTFSTSTSTGRYGVYDSKGRLRKFTRRSYRPRAIISIASGRVALERESNNGTRAVEVTDLRGRSLATMPAPVLGITDFDGMCLTWKSDRGSRSRRALYVAAVSRKVPRSSACR